MKIFKRILFILIGLVIMISIGIYAVKSEANYVTIVFPEEYESIVLTSRKKVEDILSENHVIVLPDEKVSPDYDEKITEDYRIVITKISEEPIVISEEVSNISTEEILGQYVTVTEKIIIEQVEIPYETEIQDVSKPGSPTRETVIQKGRNGLKEIKYKVRYQDNVEVERTVLSETIIREVINQIIQISTKLSNRSRGNAFSPEELEASVAGINPTVVTMNASAYCPCVICTGKTNGVTSSGAIAKEWYTLAAGKAYPVGTVIYIPSLASKPNKGWFVVEDRGGAISNNRIDIFLSSHSAAIQFGRRNLECYVYQ